MSYCMLNESYTPGELARNIGESAEVVKDLSVMFFGCVKPRFSFFEAQKISSYVTRRRASDAIARVTRRWEEEDSK